MDPAWYLESPYYEHWLTAVATGLVETGTIEQTELDERLGAPFDVAIPSGRPALPDPGVDRLSIASRVGDAVRVREWHPLGHTRAPRYVQGKRGTVVRLDGVFSVPDVEYHCDDTRREPTYSVRFEAPRVVGRAGRPGARRPVGELPGAARATMSDDHHHPIPRTAGRGAGRCARSAADREGHPRPGGDRRDRGVLRARRRAHERRQVVARAWTDPDYKSRLLADGDRRDRRARLRRTRRRTHGRRREHPAGAQRRRLHAVLVLSVAGARAAAELVQEPALPVAHGPRTPRACSPRWAVSFPTDVEIRVWDSSAEIRYLVLPIRPDGYGTPRRIRAGRRSSPATP